MPTAQMAYVKLVSLTLKAERRFSRGLLNEISVSLSDLHRHLTCVVCSKLLTDPIQAVGRHCGHYACRLCIPGYKSLYPWCNKCGNCSDLKTYEESRLMTLLMFCHKSWCVHIRSTAFFHKLAKCKPYMPRSFKFLLRKSSRQLINRGCSYNDIKYTFPFDSDLPLFEDRNRSSLPTPSKKEVESHFCQIASRRRYPNRPPNFFADRRMNREYQSYCDSNHFTNFGPGFRNPLRQRYSFNYVYTPLLKHISTQTLAATFNQTQTSSVLQTATKLIQTSAVVENEAVFATKEIQTSPGIDNEIITASQSSQPLDDIHTEIEATNESQSSAVMLNETTEPTQQIQSIVVKPQETTESTNRIQSTTVLQNETEVATKQNKSLAVMQKETIGSNEEVQVVVLVIEDPTASKKQIESTAIMQKEPTGSTKQNQASMVVQKETASVKQKQTMDIKKNPPAAKKKKEMSAHVPTINWKLDEILLPENEKNNSTQINLRSQKPIIVSSVQVKPPDKPVTLDALVNTSQPVSKAKGGKKRKHCRCGTFQGQGSLKTCRNNRCLCYTNGNSCSNCNCKGCKNPHKEDYICTDEEDNEEQPKEKKQTSISEMPTPVLAPPMPPPQSLLKGLILVAINNAEESQHPLVLVRNENNEMQCFNVFKDGVPINPIDVGFQRVELQTIDAEYSGIPKYAYMACPPSNPLTDEASGQKT